MIARFNLHIILLFVTSRVLAQPCAGMPQFVNDWGFNEGRIALSTSERHLKGLVLVELGKGNTGQAKRVREFQHPSWDDEGFLSTIARDREGNVYVAPKPNVSMLYTNKEHLNSVFRIDSKSGVMKKIVDLPSLEKPNSENAYGIVGLHYSCALNQLLVSTILGSDRNKQRGGIYAIDLKTLEVKEILDNYDALGVNVYTTSKGEYKLLYASARNSVIYELDIDESLNPIASPKAVINLEGLGPRGDDKARKILLHNGRLTLVGTTFNYNLSVPHSTIETNYIFSFLPKSQSWQLESFQ